MTLVLRWLREDDDEIDLEVEAWVDDLRFKACIFDQGNKLNCLAEEFAAFAALPLSDGASCNWSLGWAERGLAVSMAIVRRRYALDLDARDNRQYSDGTSTKRECRLTFRTEPSLLDRFISALRLMDKERQGEAVLEGRRP